MHIDQFIELLKKGYSLDYIYILNLVKENGNISQHLEKSEKFKTVFKTMIRKGLITDCGTKITLIGTHLLEYSVSIKPEKLKINVPNVDEFELWWKLFPGTDTFTYKGKKFTGSRSLRQNKDECRIKFNKILIEGDYTSKQLTDALAYDVNQKKEASLKEGRNKLTFMQNSLTYLNQRSYEAFIELINEGVEIQETPQSGTDI